MKNGKGKIYVGTSGWHYKHWIGPFYPEGTKPADFMAYYEQFFQTVEINNSFYHLPPEKTFDQWKKAAPNDFVFAVKANRFITHIKKLKDPKAPFMNFIQHATRLQEKLGPILFQLPPKWHYNEERFSAFVAMLPPDYRYTFEFRDTTWLNEAALGILKKHNMALCIYELGYYSSPIEVTADFVYIRLHGPAEKYQGNYSDKTLSEWADRCKKWQEKSLDVFVYFDNDQKGYAAINAKKLKSLIMLN